MAATNGHGQSADVFRGEFERQGFRTGPQAPQAANEILGMLPSFEQKIAPSQREPRKDIPWNAGIKHKPETARTDYPPTFPVRSRQKLAGLAEGYKNVCNRWSLDALGMAMLLHLEQETGLCKLILSGQIPPMTGDLKDRMALVIGISIGLGELFDDDRDAELQWLNSSRSELGVISPLKHMLKGDLLNVRDVADLVDKARGLK